MPLENEPLRQQHEQLRLLFGAIECIEQWPAQAAYLTDVVHTALIYNDSKSEGQCNDIIAMHGINRP